MGKLIITWGQAFWYITLRGHWCHIVVLNGHKATEDKSDDTKERPYEESDCVLDQLPTYHMKILLGDFNAKL
jgi:hypothetical protein